MNKYQKIIGTAVVSSVILIAFLLATTIVLQITKYRLDDRKLTKLDFEGTYQIDDEDILTITKDTHINPKKHEKIVFDGRFANLPEDSDINIYAFFNCVEADIYVDGEKVFEHGHEGSYPIYMKTIGSMWRTIRLDNVHSDSYIRIELKIAYAAMNEENIDRFIQNIYYGDQILLFRRVLWKELPQLLLALTSFFIGIACLIAYFTVGKIMFIRRGQILYFALFLITCGIFLLGDFHILSFFLEISAFNEMLFNSCITLCTIYLLMYLAEMLNGRARAVCYAIVGVDTLMLLLFTTIQAVGIHDFYEVFTITMFILVLSTITATGTLFYEGYIKKFDKARLTFNNMTVFSIFLLLEVCNFFFWNVKSLLFAMIGFLLYVINQMVFLIKNISSQMRKAKELEKELANAKISVMLSQIKPHFLFNALTAIKQLCSTDPEKAEILIDRFSKYLRGNLDSLSVDNLIPFKIEIEHIKNYLALEQMRFGDRIKVKYNISCEAFLLPVLSIQPLVENAVRYGITKREEGGTITITTKENFNFYKVIVEDDGVGFDTEAKAADDGRLHVGLANVRNRLNMQCNGDMIVDSKINVGTRIAVIIPKSFEREKEYEQSKDNSSR